LLEQYGPDAQPIRAEMRSVIGPFVDRIWHERPADAARPFARDAKAEGVYIAIQALSPKNDLQRSLQSRAAQISTDLAQIRLLLFAESDSAIPAPFIAILAFWLIIIFASFSLFAALNVTVFAPNDLELVQGGPAGRREYLDDVLVARHPRLDAPDEAQGPERWLEEGPRYLEPVESVGSCRRHGATFGAVQHEKFGAQTVHARWKSEKLRSSTREKLRSTTLE